MRRCEVDNVDQSLELETASERSPFDMEDVAITSCLSNVSDILFDSNNGNKSV
jgi:hypothetical protein